MQKQINEKTVRLRYIRVLEKFITKTVSLLKYDNFDKELFKKATTKAFNELQRTKSCDLYNEYPVALKNLTLYIMTCIDNDIDKEKEATTQPNNFEEEKASILKQANLLAKLKNNNRYKKDKHKHKKFNDGY